MDESNFKALLTYLNDVSFIPQKKFPIIIHVFQGMNFVEFLFLIFCFLMLKLHFIIILSYLT